MNGAALLIADRAEHDLLRAQRKGVREARRISQRVTRQVIDSTRRGTVPKLHDAIVNGLFELTRDAMMVSHMIGVKREREIFEARNITASVFDATLSQLAKRLGISLRALRGKYGIQAMRVLQDVSLTTERELQGVVGELVKAGSTLREGKRVLADAFDRLGLTPKNPYQLETIFRTQTQLAYGAGKWEADQAPEIQEILWGYTYTTVGDDRVRHKHSALDEVTLPKNDPLWERIWPPNGYNCRCTTIPVFEEREIKRPGEGGGADDGFDFNPGRVFATGTRLSFDPDQPRDEAGRFGTTQSGKRGDLVKQFPKFKAGGTVDGRKVLVNIDNEDSIGSSLTDYETMPGLRIVDTAMFDFKASDIGKAQGYRATDDLKRVSSLAEKIKASGKISPLIVVVDKEGPYILEGGHRYEALRMLGAKAFPAKIVIDRESLPDSDDVTAAFNPDQPRDERGRFGSGGSSGGSKSKVKLPAVGDEVRIGTSKYWAEPFDSEDAFPPAIASYEIEKDGLIFYRGRNGSEGVVTGTEEDAEKWMKGVRDEVQRNPTEDSIARPWTSEDGGANNVALAESMVSKTADTFGIPRPEIQANVVKRPLEAGEHTASRVLLANPHLATSDKNLNFKTSTTKEVHIAAHETMHSVYSADSVRSAKYAEELRESGEMVSLYHSLGGEFEGLMDLGAAYVHSPKELAGYSSRLYDIADRWAKDK